MKYTNCILRKGKKVIQVLLYIAPKTDGHKTPCGCRRGYYACSVNGKTRYMMTHNVSRCVRRYGFTIEYPTDCYLHAHHSIKHQENVKQGEFGLWKRFINLFR